MGSYNLLLFFFFLGHFEVKTGRLIASGILGQFVFYVLCFNVVFPLTINLSIFLVVSRSHCCCHLMDAFVTNYFLNFEFTTLCSL